MPTVRGCTRSVESYCPLADASAYLTVTLAASNNLEGYGFTADQVATADFAIIQPLTADAHVRLDGGTALAGASHRLAAGDMWQLDYHRNLDNLRIAGSGACAITLMTFGSDPP